MPVNPSTQADTARLDYIANLATRDPISKEKAEPHRQVLLDC